MEDSRRLSQIAMEPKAICGMETPTSEAPSDENKAGDLMCGFGRLTEELC